MKFIPHEHLKLYAVTDDGPNIPQRVIAAIRGGATCIQYRAKKECDNRTKLATARSLKEICSKENVPFIVNDSPDLALESGADGVHIGQTDMPISEARKMIGEKVILGVSATCVEDAIHAERNGADYLGTGAVFPTQTKKDADNVSFPALRAICGAVKIPVVAIGGIQKENVSQLTHSGISGISVISSIFSAVDISAAAQKLRFLADRTDFTLQQKTGFILDFDGTLLDSIPIWLTLAADYLRMKGGTPDPLFKEKISACTDLQDASSLLQTEYHLQFPEIAIQKELANLLKERYLTCRFLPGAIEFLKKAKQNDCPMVIGTASDHRAVTAILQNHGLSDYFDGIITTSDLKIGKNKSSFYYRALEQLGTPLSSTWLIDDTPVCLATARSAGFRTAGIQSPHHDISRFQSCTDRILNSINDWFQA